MRCPCVCLAVIALVVLNACGGSGGAPTQPEPPSSLPVFSSTPPTLAAEGSSYTYNLAASDPSGGAVTFALTAAPAGATLNGNNLSWTPTTAQSRVQNAFTVTARSASGETATQSWSVAPSGTIHVSWVDTYWRANGRTEVPGNLIANYAAVFVPKADGTFDTLTGTLSSPGHLEIPNVPAGYFWLRVVPVGTFWTSSSTFDFGSDLIGQSSIALGNSTQTTFNVTFTGVEPVEGGWITVTGPELPSFLFGVSTRPDSDTATLAARLSTNIDLSQIRNAFAIEYKPTKFGSTDGYVAGPSALLSNLAWTNGGINDVIANLSAAPKTSINLAINGADWVPLFEHVAPAPATISQTPFAYTVQPYIAGRNTTWGGGMELLQAVGATDGIRIPSLPTPGLNGSTCQGYAVHSGSSSGFEPIPTPPPIDTNQDFGTVQFGDAFPADWNRAFTVCQFAAVPLPELADPGLLTPSVPGDYYYVVNGISTTLPTAPFVPSMSPVQNPQINGFNLFTESTLNTSNITLSWEKPMLGNPVGYRIAVLTMAQGTGGTIELPPARPTTTFYTAKTSATLPPTAIVPGRAYRFVISAISDAQANFETAPNRSGLPRSNAEIISALITVSGAAQ